MDWHQFLRDERSRKLASVEALLSGGLVISTRGGGEIRDVTAEMVDQHQLHIAEIENILATAGEPLDT